MSNATWDPSRMDVQGLTVLAEVTASVAGPLHRYSWPPAGVGSASSGIWWLRENPR